MTPINTAAASRAGLVELPPDPEVLNLVFFKLVRSKTKFWQMVGRGTRLCDPCAHMEKLTVKGALRGLIHRGGLRAEILHGGWLRVGDEIRLATTAEVHRALANASPQSSRD